MKDRPSIQNNQLMRCSHQRHISIHHIVNWLCWSQNLLNMEFIRGFVSSLGVGDATTSYPFNFPSKNRAPPVSVFHYVVRFLRSMGYNVIFVQVDEDGALAHSSEFCQAIVDEHCVLETTGGGNSTNNGIVERGNSIDEHMVCATLATMDLLMGHLLPSDMCIQQFWCFALAQATMVQRRSSTLHLIHGDTPFHMVHVIYSSSKDIAMPGSKVTAIDLEKGKKTKLNPNKSTVGYFLSYGNHVGCIYYWDLLHPHQVKISYHAIVEEEISFHEVNKSVYPVQPRKN